MIIQYQLHVVEIDEQIVTFTLAGRSAESRYE